jgi:hypothetical protein
MNRGEKGLNMDASKKIFKLDAKIVLLYDEEEYPVASVEFAPYADPQKIKSDRSKLLAEARTIYNQVVELGINDIDGYFSFSFYYRTTYLTGLFI